jgi:RNA polymerase sigma factor FliA
MKDVAPKPALKSASRKPSAPAKEMSETEQLWRRYKDNPENKKLRDKLILQYLHLVRYVVNRLPVTLPVSIGPEDLVSFGTLGLIEAFERFDIDRGLKFETYAVTRIRGSIIDQLRYFDWVPRGVRRRAKELQETSTKLEQKLGRAPNEEELAEAMGVTTTRLKTIITESNNLMISLDEGRGEDGNNSLSLLDLIEDKNSPDPSSEFEVTDMRDRLAKAIDKLPEREKFLIALYYHENLTLREIGDIINVSESRVCQLHAQAILRLRNTLSKE